MYDLGKRQPLHGREVMEGKEEFQGTRLID